MRAIAKLNLEDYVGAEADASQKCDRTEPFLSDAWEVRGVARQNTGVTALLSPTTMKLSALLPRNRSLLFNKALALSDIHDYEAAGACFEELLGHYPSFDNAYLGRARMLLAAKDTLAAEADIEKALEINKNAVNAYIMRADIAINSDGDFGVRFLI